MVATPRARLQEPPCITIRDCHTARNFSEQSQVSKLTLPAHETAPHDESLVRFLKGCAPQNCTWSGSRVPLSRRLLSPRAVGFRNRRQRLFRLPRNRLESCLACTDGDYRTLGAVRAAGASLRCQEEVMGQRLDVCEEDSRPATRVLDEARCQACGKRMPQYDGQKVAATATVACTARCWESLSDGRSWGPRPFDDGPTIA
jgi:hypothetical protein